MASSAHEFSQDSGSTPLPSFRVRWLACLGFSTRALPAQSMQHLWPRFSIDDRNSLRTGQGSESTWIGMAVQRPGWYRADGDGRARRTRTEDIASEGDSTRDGTLADEPRAGTVADRLDLVATKLPPNSLRAPRSDCGHGLRRGR